MSEDLNVYGVFVPALALWMLLAFLASALVKAGLARLGFYRFVWRRPLFDLSLYVLILAAVVFLARRVSS
ncbi:DUF1656 domain-containing protein [Methylocella sp.]|uniref:DUF1656 domain-containing protein n=1 Tax=Methylocella sp. TaxID=1978226 RepID=UPI0037849EA7